MPHDFGRGSIGRMLLCWSAFCSFLGVLPRGAFAGGHCMDLDIVGFSLAEEGKVTINDGVAPASGSSPCSWAKQGMVTINDGLEPASGSAQCFWAGSGTSAIGEGVAPPLHFLYLFSFCCGPAKLESSKDRLFCRVEGAIIFTGTDAVVSFVDCEK